MNCPNCQTDVKVTEQNYGSLFTCPSCQAAYFINFEGQPEFSDNNEIPNEASSEVPSESPLENLNMSDYGDANGAPIVEFNQNEFSANEFSENLFGQIDNVVEMQPTSASAFDSIAKDISDFGNSDTQTSGLNYDLTIKGLDSTEILKIFKEAIDDRRFGWETNDVMRSIKNGEVQLEKLNPSKAYILAKRLQFLDIEKKWVQNVLN